MYHAAPQVEILWTKCRSRYRREIKKEIAAKKSGSGAVKNVDAAFLKRLEFLKPFVVDAFSR